MNQRLWNGQPPGLVAVTTPPSAKRRGSVEVVELWRDVRRMGAFGDRGGGAPMKAEGGVDPGCKVWRSGGRLGGKTVIIQGIRSLQIPKGRWPVRVEREDCLGVMQTRKGAMTLRCTVAEHLCPQDGLRAGDFSVVTGSHER